MHPKALVDVLALDGLAPARGRRPTPLSMDYVRDLGEGDLPLLRNPPRLGSSTPALKTLRNTHHMAARLSAEGRSQAEISLITGYSTSRISLLHDDPAFMELVAYYHANVEAQYLNVHERLASLGMAFVDELQERLEQKPEEFSLGHLMEGAELMLDRSVAPKLSTGGVANSNGSSGVNVTVNFVTPKPTDNAPTIDVVPSK